MGCQWASQVTTYILWQHVGLLFYSFILFFCSPLSVTQVYWCTGNLEIFWKHEGYAPPSVFCQAISTFQSYKLCFKIVRQTSFQIRSLINTGTIEVQKCNLLTHILPEVSEISYEQNTCRITITFTSQMFWLLIQAKQTPLKDMCKTLVQFIATFQWNRSICLKVFVCSTRSPSVNVIRKLADSSETYI